MAQVIVRNIEDGAKGCLTQRTNVRGWSMEAEVRLAQQHHLG